MRAKFDGCREHGRVKFTNSARTYKPEKHHRRLVCYKNSIDFFSGFPMLLESEHEMIITGMANHTRIGLQISTEHVHNHGSYSTFSQ